MTETRPSKRRKLAAIAASISAHLQRFEQDKTINTAPTYRSYKTGKIERSTKPYYYAAATARGNRVFVIYVTFQGSSSLTRDEAEQYLAWLDAGNVGTHYDARRASGRAAHPTKEQQP